MDDKKRSPPSATQETFYIGTKIGQCDICRLKRKTYLLRYGFTLCEECLSICTMILGQLQLQEANRPTLKTGRTKQAYVKPKAN